MKKYTPAIPVLSFAIISAVLVLIWFKDGSTMGGGEIGNPFYNIERMFQLTKMAWSDWGLGVLTGFSVGGAPIYKLLSIFQNLGIPGYVLQASFFASCVFLALTSAYYLTGLVMAGISRIGRFSAAIFYLVNPYALVNVWNRFLTNQIVFYSFLPLGLWLFIRGLKTKNYSFAVLNMIATAFLSIAFVGPAQTVIYWGLLFLITLHYFLSTKKDRFVPVYFLVNLGLWLLLNSFWVIQQFSFRFSQTFSTVSTVFFTATGNYETFNALSRELGQLPNLFLLHHGSFFGDSFGFPYNWPQFYNHPVSLIVQWLLIIFVLASAIKKINVSWVRFFFLLFLAGVFTSKGNTPPLGEILDFLFRNISFLEFYRNPFEKTGVLLVLGLTPLVGLAVSDLVHFGKNFKSHLRYAILFLPIIYLGVFLGFPFWTGLVFTNGYPPSNNPKIGYQVIVPNYYSEADKYLSQEAGNFRFMTLPVGGEGIINTWPKGYVGVEQSAVLFSTPSLSYDTSIPFYSGIVSSLERLFIRYHDFYRLAGVLNLKYLMFRPDFDYIRSRMRDPKIVEQIISARAQNPESKLSLAAEFPPLRLYEFDKEATLPKIYVAKRNINSDVVGDLEDALIVQNEPRDIISNYNIEHIEDRTFANISHSLAVFNLGANYPAYSEEYYVFPYVSVLPRSSKYALVRIKEKLQLFFNFNGADRLSFRILLLGKRLREAQLALQNNNIDGAIVALAIYDSEVTDIFKQIGQMAPLKQPDERTWRETEMFTIFSSHLYVLNQLETSQLNEDGYITKIKSKLVESASASKIIPRYSPVGASGFPTSNRLVYQWLTVKNGNYEILFPATKDFPGEFEIPSHILVQLDSQIIQVPVENKKEGISLGSQNLEKGLHELQLILPTANSQLDKNLELVLDTATGPIKQELKVSSFDPALKYDLSFDYKIYYGAGLDVVVKTNLDYPDPKTGDPRYSYSKGLPTDSYWYEDKQFATIYEPPIKSDSAAVIFSTTIWNNCRESYLNLPKKCLDQEIRKKFDRPTRIKVANINFRPRIPTKLFLISKHAIPADMNSAEVAFSKIDPTKYRVRIQNATEPFLLVFSELYDAGWSANIEGVEVGGDRHFLVNGYANAWWIDRNGDFDLVLDYRPQQALILGYIVSIISIGLGGLYLLFEKLHSLRRSIN